MTRGNSRKIYIKLIIAKVKQVKNYYEQKKLIYYLTFKKNESKNAA